MNAVERKLMQTFEDFLVENDMGHVLHGNLPMPIAINVLVRHDNGAVEDDCVFITRDGKSFEGGTQCVKYIGEVVSLCSQVDFLPADFTSRVDYLNEITAYTETQEDKDYYFRPTRFGFSILDVNFISFMYDYEYEPMVGTREEVEGGVRYTAGHTDNGYVFKDMNEVKNKTNNVCYIAECDFNDDEIIINDSNLARLIEWGGVCTYQSALKETIELVKWTFPAFADSQWFDEFVERVTNFVLEEVDWQCFSTLLHEIDFAEDLSYFLEEKFIAFVKERLAKDGDPTTYEDDDDLWGKISNYLGCYCYRNKDFSLTDWDELVDKWENNTAGTY